MRRFALLLGITAIVALPMAGCSRNVNAPAQVSGKVTYKGSPVPAGTIMFHAGDKGTYTSPLSPEGAYEIRDLPTGEMVVTVETESIHARKKADYGGKGAKGYAQRLAIESKNSTAAAKAPPQQYVRIPSKYADLRKSPLKATLEVGRQTQDFSLTD